MARNLKYMGLGMLGIFVVVGVVILVTFILNSITSRKKN
ncbi:MAG: oxaloacetate decarboxylase [Clostridia bacterium]|nr:oxaloacetate decarboxylase [Clostridia bacterium]